MALVDSATSARPANVWSEDTFDEVGALKQALRGARSNPWIATDVADPELESFMDAIVKPAPTPTAEPVERDRPNPWQEFFEAAK